MSNGSPQEVVNAGRDDAYLVGRKQDQRLFARPVVSTCNYYSCPRTPPAEWRDARPAPCLRCGAL